MTHGLLRLLSFLLPKYSALHRIGKQQQMQRKTCSKAVAKRKGGYNNLYSLNEQTPARRNMEKGRSLAQPVPGRGPFLPQLEKR